MYTLRETFTQTRRQTVRAPAVLDGSVVNSLKIKITPSDVGKYAAVP